MTEMSVLLCAPQNVAQKICPVMEEEIIMVVCSLSFATQAKVVCNHMSNITFSTQK